VKRFEGIVLRRLVIQQQLQQVEKYRRGTLDTSCVDERKWIKIIGKLKFKKEKKVINTKKSSIFRNFASSDFEISGKNDIE